MNNTIRKSIQIPEKVVELNKEKAKQLGLTFNSYVKYLLTRNVDDSVMVSDKVEEAYKESLKNENLISTNGKKPSEVLEDLLAQ